MLPRTMARIHNTAKKQVLKTIICIDRYLFSCHNIFLVCVLVFLAFFVKSCPRSYTHTRTPSSTHLSLYLSFSTYSLSLDRFCLRCTFLSLLFFSCLLAHLSCLARFLVDASHTFVLCIRSHGASDGIVAANSSLFLFIAHLTLVFTKADYFAMCHRNILFFGGGGNNNNSSSNNVHMHTYT